MFTKEIEILAGSSQEEGLFPARTEEIPSTEASNPFLAYYLKREGKEKLEREIEIILCFVIVINIGNTLLVQWVLFECVKRLISFHEWYKEMRKSKKR